MNNENNSLEKMSIENEKRNWSSADTKKLIAMYKTMPELWDRTNPHYKEKSMKEDAMNKLSEYFKTNIRDMRRKVHNLRCQFTTELRRLKSRALRLKAHPSEVRSDWKYFEALSYLMVNYKDFYKEAEHYDDKDFEENVDETSIDFSRELTQSDEEKSENNCRPSTSTEKTRQLLIPKCEEVFINASEFEPKKRKISDEDHRIFGEYVASELRNMSGRGAQILKMKIRKAILEVAEQEFNMDNGAEYLEFDM